ncbi:hypothetical protein N0V93_000766 [Gnomoniopsis smithogilvyi]|uniref:Uncharacterized protein n=1 Tax=Gnomoniopsis smithogilvyi TaxID=1191159 RepID=A0A9W9D233_9PEZI|nr:hypothetical protein N0V93_000766 [Gnomoniopsis smithogilvyi]
MSPIVARAALRATRAAAQQQTRQFSVMRTMRNVARSFEPHPFQRLPISNQTQAGDWSKLVKRSAGQALIYFPGFGLVLGWPLIAQSVLDGSMGSL